MKNNLKLFLAAAVLLTAASCSTTGTSASGTKPYPKNVCLVSGNGLDSMGDQQRLVHQGQELKFCCAPCVAKFQKDPDRYLANLGNR